MTAIEIQSAPDLLALQSIIKAYCKVQFVVVDTLFDKPQVSSPFPESVPSLRELLSRPDGLSAAKSEREGAFHSTHAPRCLI
jgi:hypothetical protein